MIKKIIFMIMVFIGVNLSVSAATVVPGTTIATLNVLGTSKYTMSINNSSYTAFCQDANLSYGSTSSGAFTVKEELGERNEDGAGSVQFYDQAVIAIFNYFEENGENYYAQALALRSLIALFGFDTHDKVDNYTEVLASDMNKILPFENTAIKWIQGYSYDASGSGSVNTANSIVSDIDKINAIFDTITTNVYLNTEYQYDFDTTYNVEVSYFSIDSGYTMLNLAEAKRTSVIDTTLASYYSGAVEATAMLAFKEGIQAIIDYIDSGYSTADEASITEKVYDETQLYSTDYFYTTLGNEKGDYVVEKIVLTPENFATDGNGKINLTVDADSGLTTKCYIVYGGTSYVEFNCDNANQYGIDSDDLVVVYVYAQAQEEEFCNSLNYEITYKYSEDSISSKVYIVYNSNQTTTVVYQRFLVSIPADQVTQSIEGAISPCTGDCTTEVVIPTDCLEVDLGAKDSYTGYVTPSSNVEYCIINNTDDADNSYVAQYCEYDTDGDGKTDTDNGMSGVANQTSKTYGDYTYNLTYGTVSCYEEYSKIQFPGIQDTDSGRYIKIGAYIEGTKTCITSNIDYDAFIDDIIQAQEAMVDAYNSYKEASVGLENAGSKLAGTCDTSCTNSETRYDEYYGYDSDKTVITYNKVVLTTNTNTGEGDFKYDSTAKVDHAWDDAETSKSCSPEEDPDTGATTCKCSGSCKNGSVDAEMDVSKEKKIEAEDDLEYAQNAFKQAITNLLSLIGGESFNYSIVGSLNGWSMLFPINPVIEYTYDENYTSLLSADSVYLVETEVNTTNPSYVYSSSVDVEDELDNDDAFEDRVFVYCTTSGCKEYTFKDFPTEEINHVIAEIEKTVEYETPEVFYNSYPSGTVVYYEDSRDKDSQQTLINGLPVSLNTTTGLYEFTFTITNFGEYYSDCTGGRLNEVFEETEENDYEFTNEYVCGYRVNCPECEIGTDLELIIPSNNCTTCILDGSFQMYFRTISTNTDSSSSGSLSSTFNPNDRDLGYNWTSSTEYSVISGKAETTLTEIYEIDYDAYDSEPLLTVTLTAGLASYISDEYNSGTSYADDTLTCYDWGDYENVFCYSDTLNSLSGGSYASYFEFTDVRTGSVNSDVDYSGDNYWTAWKITETTEYYFGGPAWK